MLLAIVAGFLFGGLTVAIGVALSRSGADAEAGAAITSIVAMAVAVPAAVAFGGPFVVRDLWPFALIGLGVPGASQLAFIKAIRAAGPARAAVVIGIAPLVSAGLAVAVLGERPHLILAVATAVIVAGCCLLALDGDRPDGFRAVGLALAGLCAVAFAVRDNLVRAVVDGDADPLWAAAVSLVAASVFLTGYLLARRAATARQIRRSIVPFLRPGIALGFAYVALVEAFAHGKVTLVAPLNATQSLWGVVLSVVLLGRAERVTRRLVAAALLVVVGSVLVGIFR